MGRDICTIDEVRAQSAVIANAIGMGALELTMFSTFGEKPLEGLPHDDKALDYVIESPES